ncbi:hypothetical protein M2650_12705 [Luteimonas sp. SX5]|uniref:Uncharacterized protein n=1 Tax=Luteimonas galliterrae TaxID=2940486 RepID=A0ABT0MKT0_9GAMM|nr:hypothetical protein [Luteimonas galliterrae]MCL1635482.1 hypothetical protein [Luteimonas galliterrae]
MKHLTSPLLFLSLALAARGSVAQESLPVPSIADATYAEYRNEYRASALCGKEEITLWSCETRRRAYALCSSPVVTRTSGYMQYRAANRGKMTFQYPAAKSPPTGLFSYVSYGNGNASLEFTSSGYHYMLLDPLRENSSIVVSPPAGGKETEIACPGNQTLQVNYTMRLMYDSGVWLGK